jgi:dipeptidyl aminopeptidase/acylaminoacyl peptidase
MKKVLLVFLIFVSYAVKGQKKELDHTVYDAWQSIKDIVTQPKGKFVAYTITPQEGDGVLVIRNITSGNDIKIERGYKPVFTDDGQFLISKIAPFYADTRKAKIDKKKADEFPKDSMVIVNLNNSTIEKVPSVKSFQIPEHGNGVLAYLKDKKGDINKEGTELILRDLNSTVTNTYSNIASYSIHPKALGCVMYQVKNKTNPAKVLLISIGDSIGKTISSHFNTVTGFSWDESGKQLAYLIEKDSTDKAFQKNYSLAYYQADSDTASIIVNRSNTSLPNQYTLGGDRKPQFSKSGASLEFGIQPILPIKDTSLPDFERASLDIWHYADAILQPMQLKNLDASLKSTETVLYHINNGTIVYLGKIKERDLISTKEGDGAITFAVLDSNDAIASQWQGYSLKDIYAINNQTGQRALVRKAWKGNLISSAYDGTVLVYYDEPVKKYYAYDLLTSKQVQIAKDIKHPLFDEENDVPDDPNAYGIAKWLNDNQHLIIYDRYDLWLVDAKGIKPSLKLTNGRINQISYRFVETDNDRKTLSNQDIILVKGFDEKNKSESLSHLNLSSKKLTLINQVPMHITNVVGSKKSTTFFVLQEDEKSSPNVYSYDLKAFAQTPTPLSKINPQQSDYNWMTSMIVKWKSYTGKIAEGVLYLPENFDPKKKYPMIVYFYERNNQTLHNYLPPAPTASRLNIPFFASRGYVIFVPDIWYQKGYPGQGAYDYILSGTRAMIQKGFIDSTKVGLQGQSWGGYQIAYLITKTKLYAAAWAGAPVVNMTSAYGGIRWGTGMNRQFQYEKTQSRIGASLWERPDLYIKNSPLFSLPAVTTPLVIMSNDADDAVPWYQGIEYFTAMRRLNKKMWMLVYNNEAHNLVERKNKKDIQIREQQFFDHYLKGAPMPTWMRSGVPAIMKGRDWGLN